MCPPGENAGDAVLVWDRRRYSANFGIGLPTAKHKPFDPTCG